MKFAAAVALALLAFAAAPARPQTTASAFRYDDAERFYQLYHAAAGRPSAPLLQRFYIDSGSPAVRDFIPERIISAERLAEGIANNRPIYDEARRCLTLMPQLRAMTARSIARWRALYPQARIPAVTILVGRNNSGGTTSPAGVIIGLEVACRAESPSLQPLEERLDSLIAHEIAHASQPYAPVDTLLEAALKEGVAELVAELISGEILNDHLKSWTADRETEIARRFLADRNRRDGEGWMFNGIGTPEEPGDLGYWVGYRIARSYYDRQSDKQAALKRLLTDPDVEGILRDSGWGHEEREVLARDTVIGAGAVSPGSKNSYTSQSLVTTKLRPIRTVCAASNRTCAARPGTH